MTVPGRMLVVPEALVAAAAALDAIADQVQTAAQVHLPTLRLLPAGHEEVSTGVMGFHNIVVDSFETATATGIAELRQAAATLRTQAAAYAEQDAVSGAAIGRLL